MKLILQKLKAYLIDEGLSEFLPKGQRQFNPSFIWLASQMLLSGFVSIAHKASFWLGTLVPFLTIFLCLFLYGIYFLFREARKMWIDKNYVKPDISKPPKEDAILFGGIVLFGIPILGAIGILLLTKNWIAIPVYLLVATFITLLTTIFIQNDYIFVDLFRQLFKGWAFSWQAVLKTIPILAITIFLSLFSGDIWRLIDSISWSVLVIIALMILAIIIPGIKTNRNWIHSQVLEKLDSAEKISQRLLVFPRIAQHKEDRYISIEDLEDITDFLQWRDVRSLVNYHAKKFSHRIEWRYSLAAILSTLLLGLSLFVGLGSLFWILSPGLVKVGWLQVVYPKDLQGISLILKFSFFISTLQMATFLANLLDKPRENIISIGVLEKAVDWVSAIILFQAITFPTSQIWSMKRETQGVLKKWDATNGNIIVRENLSNEDVEQICKKIETAYIVKTDKVNFKVYRNRPGLIQELEADKDNFNWHYIHNPSSNHVSFSAIPENIDFSSEEHLLGRDYLKQGKAIPDSWLGNASTIAEIGRAIWDLDDNHHCVMHPSVWKIKDKNILNIEIRLFKKLPDDGDYIKLATNSLQVSKKILGNLGIVNIFFPYRFEGSWICDFQLIEDGNLLFTKNGKTKKLILNKLTFN